MSSNSSPVCTSSIHWFSNNGRQEELFCPVCRKYQSGTALLQVPSMADGTLLTLFACSSCDSVYYNPPEIKDFSDIHGDKKSFLKSYVEVGGGIWEMYWPAASSTQKLAATLLDVGCGFGFTVDVWLHSRGNAIGLELADYGRAGAELLGVPIHFDYLHNIPTLRTRKFDVVYASEVIEHVPDPREFAILLSKHVSGEGVLCLTTPNANYIREENTSSTLLAALAPGFHGFLIGPSEMESILRTSGFPHVLVRQYGERLIAWASRSPLDIQVDAPQVRKEYLQYLDDILENRKANDFVTDGIAYRKFRDTVFAGQYEKASGALEKLEVSLNEKYPLLRLHEPEQSLAQVRLMEKVEDYDAAFPWFLPNLYFVRGMYAKLVERNEKMARRYFCTTRNLTTFIASSWGTVYVLEALGFFYEAWRQESMSAALKGDTTVCEEWLGEIQSYKTEPRPASMGEKPSCRQIETAYMDGLSIYYKLKPEYLEKTLDQCMQYLQDQYGEWQKLELNERKRFPCNAMTNDQRMNFLFTIVTVCLKLQCSTEMIRALLNQILYLEEMKFDKSPRTASIVSQSRKLLEQLAPKRQVTSWQNANSGTVNYSFSFKTKSPEKG